MSDARKPTADPATELSSCCNAPATYDGDGTLYCKKCYEALAWQNDPGTPLGVDTFGTAVRLNLPGG